MKKINQKGFAIAETLLVFIIILALVGIGAYVWKSQEEANKTLDSTSAAAQSTTASTSKTTSSTQKYLVVKEWDVKLPLSDAIESAYYIKNDDDPAIYVSIEKYKGTDCDASGISLGAILRFDPGEKDTEGTLLSSRYPRALLINGHYYQYQHPQAACDGRKSSDDTTPINDIEAQKSSLLMTQFSQASNKLVEE